MIPRRHMRKLYQQSNVLSLGRAPTHWAICHRKTPSPNLLLILITNRKLRLCLWRFLCDAGMGYEAGSAGATGKLQMSLKHSWSSQLGEALTLCWSLYCRWIGKSRATGSLSRKPSCSKSQLPLDDHTACDQPKILLCRLRWCIPAI